ncbi:MAG: HIT domain-containing protein [bacterium]|jgi:ATP adenylyltransferase
MEIISAGWRMEYIEGDSGGECIFCARVEGCDDAEQLIVRRGESAFVLMNRYPYTTGHLMVAPYRHVGTMSDLTREEACELMSLLAWCESILTKSINPGGFNVGINIGECAGAGVPGHIHIHVVPRWEGDTNFMPVVSETKVLPEVLTDTYRKIKSAMGDEEQAG